MYIIVIRNICKIVLLVFAFSISKDSPAAWGDVNTKYIPMPADTMILEQILSLPLNTYIGKPVDSLFSVLPVPFTHRGFIPAKAGYCVGVYQVYGDSELNTVSVQVFVDQFQFMTFPNITPSTTWNINLAKKERISFIRVTKNNIVCVYGCNNPNYTD